MKNITQGTNERLKALSHYIRDRNIRGEISYYEAIDALMKFMSDLLTKGKISSKRIKPQLDLELMIETDKMTEKQRTQFIESKIQAINTNEKLASELKEKFMKINSNP